MSVQCLHKTEDTMAKAPPSPKRRYCEEKLKGTGYLVAMFADIWQVW